MEISDERLSKANRFVSLNNTRAALAKLMTENKEKSLAKFNETKRPSIFWPGDLVVVWRPPRHKKTQEVDNSKKLALRAVGPFRVILRKDKDAYELEHLFSKERSISNASKMTQYRPWEETYGSLTVPADDQPLPPTSIYDLLNDEDVYPPEPDISSSLVTSHGNVLRAKKLSASAKLPRSQSPGAAGYELFAAYDFDIPPGSSALVPTDIALQLPVGLSGRISPRPIPASVSVNAQVEILTPDFRGNVGVLLHNNSSTTHTVRKHDKIAQLFLEQTKILPIVETNFLSDTARDKAGFD